MDQPDEPDAALRREVGDASRPVLEEIGRAAHDLWTALGGAEGIAGIEAAIDARDAAQAAWEADHPGLKFGQMCHCFCRARGHGHGMCNDDAVTWQVYQLRGEPVQVPLCQACAQ